MQTMVENLSERVINPLQAFGCRVCGNKNLAVLLTPREVQAERRWLADFFRSRGVGSREKDKVSFTQSDPVSILRCSICGTILRNPQPNAALLREIYGHDHYEPGALDALEANQAEFFAQRVEAMRPLLKPGAAVLEVGSFTGAFLKAADATGWHPTGMDIGAESLAHMRKSGLRVIRGDICDCSLVAASRDAIFIWNTFDQLAQPRLALARVAETLKPQGLLVLRIPNGDFKTGCLVLEQQPRGPSFAEHVRQAQAYNNFMTFPYLVGYTRRSITALLRKHGFEILSVYGDTLVNMGNGRSTFAEREEQRFKRVTIRICRSIEAVTQRCYYPWLNVIARKKSR